MRFSRFPYVTFTVTVASPAVFTSTDHELYQGDTVKLSTTGALPTGLSIDTTYYVLLPGLAANTFRLSATEDGTAITTTGTQSGTHSFVKTNVARLRPVSLDNR